MQFVFSRLWCSVIYCLFCDTKKHLKYLLSINEAASTLLLFKGKIRTKTNAKFLVMLSHCYEWFGHLL